MKKIVLGMVIGVFAVPTIAIAGGPGPRFAFPALNCRLYGTQASDTFFNPSGYAVNGLKNTSSSLKYLACPIAKIAEDPQQIGGWRDAKTRLARFTMSASDGTCKLYGRSLTGSTRIWHGVDTIQSVDDGLWQYTISATNQGGSFFDTSDYSLSLYCGIPAGAYANNYEHQTYWYEKYY